MAYRGNQHENELAQRMERVIIDALQSDMEEGQPAVPAALIAGVFLRLTAVFAVGEECCYKADRMVDFDETIDAMNRELVEFYEVLTDKYLGNMN
jgi:hypothetical protein